MGAPDAAAPASAITTWRLLAPGQRVVVRRRLTGDESVQARAEGRGAVWTDIIAVVVAVDDSGLRLLTDASRQLQAREVHVPGQLITAAKPIPPRPARRR
jgi:hypothetical protein